MSSPLQKRVVHIKEKCKTLRETEFFPRSRPDYRDSAVRKVPPGLENSVSAARFLNMSGILKDLLLPIAMRRIPTYNPKTPVIFREFRHNMSRLLQKWLHIEPTGVYTVKRIS